MSKMGEQYEFEYNPHRKDLGFKNNTKKCEERLKVIEQINKRTEEINNNVQLKIEEMEL